MKTTTAFCVLLLMASMGFGQQPLTYIDSSLDTAGATRHTEIQASLQKLFEKADEQLKKLEEQLKRTGDYLAAENSEAVIAARKAMNDNGTTSVKTNAELATMREDAKGEDVFNAENDEKGIFKSISETYQFNTGKKDADGKFIYETRTRDGNEYTAEAKKLADIKEFYAVRDAAITKQKNLEDARIQAHTDLLETDDAVETQRLTALISSIDAELIAVRQDVANASHELEMHEKAIQLQQVVDAKSKQEDLGRKKGTTQDDIAEMVKGMIDAAKARSAEDKKRGRLEERKSTPEPEESPDL